MQVQSSDALTTTIRMGRAWEMMAARSSDVIRSPAHAADTLGFKIRIDDIGDYAPILVHSGVIVIDRDIAAADMDSALLLGIAFGLLSRWMDAPTWTEAVTFAHELRTMLPSEVRLNS